MTQEQQILLDEIIEKDLPFNSKEIFKKRHNLNLGLYEPAFEIHDYQYYICSTIYKRYIFTKEIKYKELYYIVKAAADLNLYKNIVCLSHYKVSGYKIKRKNIFSKLIGRIIGLFYFYYFKTFGKYKSITLGRKLKILESTYVQNGWIPVTIDQLKKALIRNKIKK